MKLSAASHFHVLLLADDKWLYMVALPKQIVRVHEHILAPEYREGEPVLFRGANGSTTAATVLATDASMW